MELTGRSYWSLYRESGYLAVRDQVTVELLRDVLREDESLYRTWLTYSDSKRTSGGWALMEGKNGYGVARPFGKAADFDKYWFSTLAEACPLFIKNEVESTPAVLRWLARVLG